MAQKFKVLFFLLLVVACLGNAVEEAATTEAPSVTTPGATDPSKTTPPASTAPSVSTVPTEPSVTADPSVSGTPTSSKVTDAETSATSLTTPHPDSCDPNPCGPGSTCEARAHPHFVCLCQAGDIYNNVSKSCQAAKVFPGDLVVPNITYSPAMKNPKSPEFIHAAQQIDDALDEVFESNDGYSGSIVLKLELGTIARVWSRQDQPVKATVEISFSATSEVTTANFMDTIKKQLLCDTCPFNGGSFTDASLCTSEPCDKKTTDCLFKDGTIACICLESYIATPFSERMCIACPSGQRAEGNNCVKCSFGRSGLNCSESWQLTLVIVASVLGALLLITLIILPIVALKSSKKSPKKNKNADIREPYANPIPAKAPLVNDSFANRQAASANRSANAFANAGMPQIPRATTTSGWDRGNLEMTPSNSRQNLVPGGRHARLYEDDDDMAPYSQSRPQSSLYAQAQSQSNPYAQNLPQVNPYASNQGNSNPYYMQDDGRRFN